MTKKYQFPECLKNQCHLSNLTDGLSGRPEHISSVIGNAGIKCDKESYKTAIYEAVVRSKGIDVYTGKKMRWDLISKYDNDQSKAKGREYKKEFGDLPTLDHVDDGSGSPQFNICSWRVNDAKNDLTLDEFLAVCREVLEFNK